MKKVFCMAFAAVMLVLASCGSKNSSEEAAASGPSYDGAKAKELAEKYQNSDPSEMSEEDANAIADLVVVLYNDQAAVMPEWTKADMDKQQQIEDEFDKAHPNNKDITSLYNWYGSEKASEEKQKAVEDAKTKMYEARQKAMEEQQ